MASLHQLAEEGNLPSHQNIDKETLSWIKDNKPEELRDIDYSEIIRSIDVAKISKLIPDESRFTSKNKVNSLHGIRHLMRVATYAFYLSLQVQSQTDRNSVLLASLLHDIRRETDKRDEGHAKRGADWYLKNKDVVQAKLGLSNVDEHLVAELIRNHESGSPEDLKLLDVLKTADALDRYVQPGKKWWINEEYLQLKPSLELKAFAYNLVVSSEEKYLDGVDSKQSVINSLLELKN